ncbi:alpha/beta hydrolase family esterase, partial [Streptomyces flavofungini]|uniref:alpha/beta hydrolase family esterase n=1 Tax=Streptomyces flavofungini TaxID=68200 RepID=UPI0034E0472D
MRTSLRRRLGAVTAVLAMVAVAAPAAASPLHRSADDRAASSGCHTSRPYPAAGQTSTRTVTVDGVRRTYLLHVPASYDPRTPTPLVLSFHGHGRTADYQERLTGMSGLDALVAYPQGMAGTDGKSAWQGAPYSADVDDIAFTRALIGRLQGTLCVDSRRVYAAGKSNGGGFAALVGCRLADRVAAVAAVSGAFYPQGGECRPRRPLPVIDFHGQADTTIPYAGNAAKGLPALPDWLAGWAERDGCRAEPRTTRVEANVVKQRWSPCPGRASVEHYR